MAIRYDDGWVTPCDMKKCYVYALYDLNGLPFYIGKGKGYRLNNHVKPSLLKEKSYKNHKIKQIIEIQGYVRREVLSYHDTDVSALYTEEFLIQHYGIASDGGILTNVCKSHWDIPEKALRGQHNKPKTEKKYKVTDQQLIDAYKRYSEQRIPLTQLADELGISSQHLGKVFDGKKRKDLRLSKVTIPTLRTYDKDILIAMVHDRFNCKYSYSQLMNKYSMPKTSVARILKMEGCYSFLKEYAQ